MKIGKVPSTKEYKIHDIEIFIENLIFRRSNCNKFSYNEFHNLFISLEI